MTAGQIIRRLIGAVIAVIGITAVSFALLHLVAPSPAEAVLGAGARPVEVRAWNQAHGYGRTEIAQCLSYLWGIARLKFGYSYTFGESVNALFDAHIGRSAYLAGAALGLSILIAVPVGIARARGRGGAGEDTVREDTFSALNLALCSVPSVVIGILLIQVFARDLGLFPTAVPGTVTTTWGAITHPEQLLLPIATLTLIDLAWLGRYVRGAALDTLGEDCTRLARAEGLRERAVLLGQLLRDAALPLIILVGLSVPALVPGSLLIEVLFDYPGLGRLFYHALQNEDGSVLLGATVLGGILTVLGRLIADLTSTLRRSVGAPQMTDLRATRRGWRPAAGRYLANRGALVGLLVLVFFILFCFAGPLVHHGDRTIVNPLAANLPPSARYPLGTEQHGFDELGQIMVGGQTALEIGCLSALTATVIGALYGAISGLLGGLLDGILMRFVDLLLSIPAILILLVLATKYSATVIEESLILAAFSWLVPARLVRGEVLTPRVRGFVRARRATGGDPPRIVSRELIASALPVVIVSGAFLAADSILALASLGFLGFGLRYPLPSWGDMLGDAKVNVVAGHWWLVYPVGFCLAAVVLAVNLIGTGLRDALGVRLPRR